jgi:hypothetical protein
MQKSYFIEGISFKQQLSRYHYTLYVDILIYKNLRIQGLVQYTQTSTLCFNLLKPAGYGMHQQFEYFNNCTLYPHCICVFCIYLRTNSDLCH